MEDKATIFRPAFKIFIEKESPNTDDYFDLCFHAAQSVRQGSGILWPTMKDIIDEELMKKKYNLK